MRFSLRRWVPVLLLPVVTLVIALALTPHAAGVGGAFRSFPERFSDGIYYATGYVGFAVSGHDSTCAPVPPTPPTVGVPSPTVVFQPGSDGTRYTVVMSHAECAWIDFDVPNNPDIHVVWTPPLPHDWDYTGWGRLQASRSKEVPYTVTALGPGGNHHCQRHFPSRSQAIRAKRKPVELGRRRATALTLIVLPAEAPVSPCFYTAATSHQKGCGMASSHKSSCQWPAHYAQVEGHPKRDRP